MSLEKSWEVSKSLKVLFKVESFWDFKIQKFKCSLQICFYPEHDELSKQPFENTPKKCAISAD